MDYSDRRLLGIIRMMPGENKPLAVDLHQYFMIWAAGFSNDWTTP